MTISDRKHVGFWLFTCCTMVLLIVWIGGITRLTESGLSIVEWKPFSGIVPPLNEADWQEEFAKYKRSPEYKKVNNGMMLSEFKSIFALEYIHRLGARLLGLVFLLPFLYFAYRKKLDRPLMVKFALIFILGGLQGAIGWFMVKSGLQDDPHVSQYRLALHLGGGFLIYGLLLWQALCLRRNGTFTPLKSHITLVTRMLLDVIFLQVLSGALVAKLHAGLIYNTFPLMDGKLIPNGIFMTAPWYLSVFEDVTTVQFMHRVIACVIATLTAYIFIYTQLYITNKLIKISVNLMTLMVLLQISLGIATLLGAVPIALASMHQIGALMLFSMTLFSLHTMTYRK